MTTTEHRTPTHDQYPDWGWKGLAALGAVMVIGGFIAFLNPFAASLTVEVLAGVAFLVAGLMQLWLVFTDSAQAASDRWLAGGLGAVWVLLAVGLLASPLAGLVTLTILVALLFAVMGGLRVAMALRVRPRDGWGWLMASGVMSLLLAALIVIGLPGAALGILGIFLGIDLTFAGAMTLAMAWQVRKHEA